MADLKDAIEGIKKTIEDAVASGDLIPRADAQAAVALMVAQAATQADPWDGPVTKNKIVDAQAIAAQQIKARIRALAPADGLAAVDALRAEARENAMQALASMGQAQEAYEAQLEAEAELATLRAQIAALAPPPDFEEGAAIGYAQAMHDIKRLRAQVERLTGLIQWAHDTLWELNPGNYGHDDVCKVNDAAVEVILGLAPIIGETHGHSVEWWEARAALTEGAAP